MSEDDLWLWDTGRDMEQAKKLRKYMKDEILNKVIGVVEPFKNNDIIVVSDIIEKIKQVIGDEN